MLPLVQINLKTRQVRFEKSRDKNTTNRHKVTIRIASSHWILDKCKNYIQCYVKIKLSQQQFPVIQHLPLPNEFLVVPTSNGRNFFPRSKSRNRWHLLIKMVKTQTDSTVTYHHHPVPGSQHRQLKSLSDVKK